MSEPTANILTAQDLEKSYGATRVLRGVSLQAARGEILGIMGPSGSGKSTLLNLLGGIDRPDAGRIVLDGRNLPDLPAEDLAEIRRHRIGTVFQFFHLLPTLTVEENIRFPLDLTDRDPQEARERVDSLLARTGLESRAHALPDQLSGGEMQRTAIARALAPRPALLLADEPTGNLDSQTGDNILALLSELARESGSAMVMVTHSDHAAGICHRVITLHDGRLAVPASAG